MRRAAEAALLLVSGRLQVGGRHLAAALVALEVEADLLALDEATHSGTLDRRDMHEDVLVPGLRLDEAIALLGVEPLHGSDRHVGLSIEKKGREASLRPRVVLRGESESRPGVRRSEGKQAGSRKIDG